MTQAMLRPLPERAPAPALDGVPVAVGGKFFFVGDHKIYVRGISYGPFGDSDHGFPFPSENLLETDLRLMAELGANTLRTFTVPPRWLLDRAARARAARAGDHPLGRARLLPRPQGPGRGDPWHGPGGRRQPGGASGALRAAHRQRDPPRHRALVRAGEGPGVPAHAGRRHQAGSPGYAGELRQLPVHRVPRPDGVPRFRLVQRLPAPRGGAAPLSQPAAEHRRGQAARPHRVRRRLDPGGRGAPGRAGDDDGARGVRVGRGGVLRLLVDGRLVHRRRADRRLGVRPGRREAGHQAGVPCHPGAVHRAVAAPAGAGTEGVGGDLRLQRRAHHGRVPRVGAHPELPELRGGGGERRLDGSHARDQPGAPEEVRGRSAGAAVRSRRSTEQGSQRRSQRRCRGGHGRDHRVHRLRLRARP